VLVFQSKLFIKVCCEGLHDVVEPLPFLCELLGVTQVGQRGHALHDGFFETLLNVLRSNRSFLTFSSRLVVSLLGVSVFYHLEVLGVCNFICLTQVHSLLRHDYLVEHHLKSLFLVERFELKKSEGVVPLFGNGAHWDILPLS